MSKDLPHTKTTLGGPRRGERGQKHSDDYDAHEVTDVPAPIPDTGPPPSQGLSLTTTHVSSASQASHAPLKSTFVPLPPLKTLNLTSLAAERDSLSSASSRTSSTLALAQGVTSATDKPVPTLRASSHRLSTSTIIALSIGGGFVLLVIFVMIRLIRRPHRRKTPTPSLPILQDGTFPDEKYEPDHSPVFGGKERFSPPVRNTKGNTGLWTWTQYQSGIPKPAPTVTVTRSSDETIPAAANNNGQENQRISCQGRDQYPFTGIGNVASKTGISTLQPAQNAITRAVSRLSTISLSLYPDSPGYSQAGTDVGVAIDGTTTNNESMSPNAPRRKDRLASARNRASMLAPTRVRDAAALRRSQSFAYGGMEVTSPTPPGADRTQPNGGRVRIKSTYYTPGLYARTSTAASSHPRADHDRKHADGTRHPNHIGMQRSDSQRAHALTNALGLMSPIPPSPHPTLYPDDSMSVIGEGKNVAVTGRSHKKPVPKQHSETVESPAGDAARLGNLMMVEFAASKSTASLVNIRPSEAAREREAPVGMSSAHPKAGLKKRAEDKPPRVPSPPPLPSLAQMALAHANPEAYADYHSPTYSIYGLYDGDRKSRASTSFGY
ncbi:hypothetical protein F5I97DRAFT_1800846 [Phlebopus sp. FC_14]|nr:hypothetical protein F5I97DRAFT_1800846 [Phlebopus sp. FC_14]